MGACGKLEKNAEKSLDEGSLDEGSLEEQCDKRFSALQKRLPLHASDL